MYKFLSVGLFWKFRLLKIDRNSLTGVSTSSLTKTRSTVNNANLSSKWLGSSAARVFAAFEKHLVLPVLDQWQRNKAVSPNVNWNTLSSFEF